MKIKKLFLIAYVIALTGTLHAQTPKTNIQKFEDELYSKLEKEIIFKGYDFEGFNICINVNAKGKIDSTLISLSAIGQVRDNFNRVKHTFNYLYLNAEIKEKGWKEVNIIIPVLILYESFSLKKGVIQLADYADKRLNYFSTVNPISIDDFVSNCILFKQMVFVKSEPIR